MLDFQVVLFNKTIFSGKIEEHQEKGDEKEVIPYPTGFEIVFPKHREKHTKTTYSQGYNSMVLVKKYVLGSSLLGRIIKKLDNSLITA